MPLREDLAQDAHKILDMASTQQSQAGEIGEELHVVVMEAMHRIRSFGQTNFIIRRRSWDRKEKPLSTVEALQVLGGKDLAQKFSKFKGDSRRERRSKPY